MIEIQDVSFYTASPLMCISTINENWFATGWWNVNLGCFKLLRIRKESRFYLFIYLFIKTRAIYPTSDIYSTLSAQDISLIVILKFEIKENIFARFAAQILFDLILMRLQDRDKDLLHSFSVTASLLITLFPLEYSN